MVNWPLKRPVLPVEKNVNGISIGLVILFRVRLPEAVNRAEVLSILIDLKLISGYFSVLSHSSLRNVYSESPRRCSPYLHQH